MGYYLLPNRRNTQSSKLGVDMTIPLVCATCGAKLKAPHQVAGRMMKCPKCQADVNVPAPTERKFPPISADAKHSSPRSPDKQVSARQANPVSCPECGRQILVTPDELSNAFECVNCKARFYPLWPSD